MQTLSILVSVSNQTLTARGPVIGERVYRISTSRFGIGTEPGSFKTPLGRFEVAKKIGGGAPLGAVFKSRVPTGETGDPSNPDNLVQTRILWLQGLDPENKNTFERYIYIHGTNHEDKLGSPDSHGCVCMGNADVAELYDFVAEGTLVQIQP